MEITEMLRRDRKLVICQDKAFDIHLMDIDGRAGSLKNAVPIK